MNKKMQERISRLMPHGKPKYVRCYDDGKSRDRYTVVFTGNYRGRKGCDYLGMSASPLHPQGVGMHGWNDSTIDTNKSGFAPAIGRKNHLGLRIAFEELPEDCQKLVLDDYKAIWELEDSEEVELFEEYACHTGDEGICIPCQTGNGECQFVIAARISK